MITFRRFVAVLILAALSLAGDAGGAVTKVRKGYDMDYGPFQCYTVGMPDESETRNMAVKGIAIRLGEEPGAAVCFDTELMRYFAAWEGDFLDRSKTHLTSGKGTLHVRIGGDVVFRTEPGPGWGRGRNLEDPRKVKPTALPRDWAHYKGLYRFENTVVLHYEVGGVSVWDVPRYEVMQGNRFFTRDLELDPTKDELTMVVLDAEKGSTGEVQGDGRRVEFRGKRSIAVGVFGGGDGVELDLVQGNRLVVRMKPSAVKQRFKVWVWTGENAGVESARLAAADVGLGPAPTHFTRGGAALWPEEVITKGRRGLGTGAYVVDTLTLPDKNPWNSWMRLIGLDFFSDGRAAVATWNGDIWVCSGIDDSLKNLRWKRYASGLFEGLGIKIVDDQIYVVERSQLTRLHDLNGDGEADYYENFNNDAPAGPSYHAFAFGLDTDRDGNFYYTRCGHRVKSELPLNGGMVKVSKDGLVSEMYATGMRAPNGMSIGPNDEITCSDNEGHWVPSSRINLVQEGGFYGFVPHARRATEPKEHDRPICWLPKTIDNSSGGQVWVTSDRWGPLKGELLHMSYGKCRLFHVMTQREGDRIQGGVYGFPLRFASGVLRARFHPGDGQLYLVGLGGGWQTSGVREGALQRVRYTGKALKSPVGMRVLSNGIEVTFSDALDRESAEDDENYAVERWNYRWTASYGSKDYSVLDPAKQERDEVEVREVRLLPDGRTVFLGLGPMAEADQMRIQFRVGAEAGGLIKGELYNTVNWVPGEN